MPSVAVVGAGPAGLMAAEVLAHAGLAVTVFDRMGSVGRKFLLAGRGGLNITHSEELPRFLARYADGNPRLCAAIESFPPTATRAWCNDLGQKTFIGSSGRIFPNAFKSSPLLRAWLRRLIDLGVQFKLRHRWIGWDNAGSLKLETPEVLVAVRPQACILALGGASWPRLGADGSWVGLLAAQGIDITPLRPANCGFLVPWSESVQQPLRRAAIETNYIVVSWPDGAWRGDDHPARCRGRRDLCSLGRAAGHNRHGRRGHASSVATSRSSKRRIAASATSTTR